MSFLPGIEPRIIQPWSLYHHAVWAHLFWLWKLKIWTLNCICSWRKAFTLTHFM